MATSKRPPGRPKKPPADKLEQFSIRLPPNLKFGLELLANHQKRSLSEVIQWALRVGLASWQIANGVKLGDVLERLWDLPEGADRILAVYEIDPALLTFDDRIAAELVIYSMERVQIEEEHSRGVRAAADLKKKRRAPEAIVEEHQRVELLRHARLKALHDFTAQHWDKIREFAKRRADEVGSTRGLSILVAGGVEVDNPRVLLWSLDRLVKR